MLVHEYIISPRAKGSLLGSWSGRRGFLLRMRTPHIIIQKKNCALVAVYRTIVCRGGRMFCERVLQGRSCPLHSQRTYLGARQYYYFITYNFYWKIILCKLSLRKSVKIYDFCTIVIPNIILFYCFLYIFSTYC